MGRASRDKGARRERDIVNMHRQAGIRAERVPLSGAAHYQGAAHDVDIYPRVGAATSSWFSSVPICAEIKARKKFPAWLTDWLADNDALILVEDRADQPLVVLPWTTWERIIK